MPRKTVKRDKKGRIVAGSGSLNPGGVPRAALELRMLALEDCGEALAQARKMMRSKDPIAKNFGITHIFQRGLGKAGSAAELPEGIEMPKDIPTSPAELHSLAMRGLAQSLIAIERRGQGHVLSSTEIELQASAAQTLSTLLREDRELGKRGPGSALSDKDLAKEVLGGVPDDQLEAELARRRAPKP